MSKESTLREEARTRNDHTGKELRSKVPTKQFRDNWDKIKWLN